MIERRCTHCEAEVEIPEGRATRCPVCGTDPDLPRATFVDAAPFYFAIPVEDLAEQPAGTLGAG